MTTAGIARTIGILVLLVLSATAGCERPRFHSGEGCEINSDCASPLACVIGVCRRQCVDSRDCGAGLRCLITSETLGGGCQLEHERTCSLASECTAPLVCQSGTCTTVCREDRDCAPGASCMADVSGSFGCYEELAELCVYNTDCPDPMICGRDELCHLECLADRDCTAPRSCIGNLCELPDGGL